jgi:caffeoyl-CoA O-methyltransferase
VNKQFGNDDERLAAYIAKTYVPEDDVLREIRERCRREGLPEIQIGALDARHLEVLASVAGARKAVEIGTLGGYSGVSLLRGMGIGGVLDTVEIDPRHAEVARESFRRAGYTTQARIHLGAAVDVLPKLAAQGPYDLCFIDADKDGYPDYLNWAADNLRPGGLVLADNVFLFGELADKPTGARAPTIAGMQAFHQILANSGRFRATVLPTGEGLAVGVRI